MNKKTVLIVSIYYSLNFMAGASFISYITLYYSEIGLNNAQIGIISAVMAFIALVFQPLLGTISDKSVSKNTILKVVILLCALTTWLIPLAHREFWWIVVAVALFSIFHSAINPLSDTITLELAYREGFKFSKVRMAGSMGFAAMAAIAGKIFSLKIWYIFPVFFVLRMAAYILSFFIPVVKGHKNSKNQVGFLELFKDKKLILLYTYIFILSSSSGFFNSFHAIYSKQVGISISLIGIGVMMGSLCQFPFMAAFDSIYRKFGLTNILIFSGCIYGLRWLLYATMLTPHTILFLWMLHGVTNIVVYLCLTEYVSTSVQDELRTRGQMMNAIILNGLSAITGGYFGGIASTYIGLKQVFMICAIACFVAVTIFFSITKSFDLKEKYNKKASIP